MRAVLRDELIAGVLPRVFAAAWLWTCLGWPGVGSRGAVGRRGGDGSELDEALGRHVAEVALRDALEAAEGFAAERADPVFGRQVELLARFELADGFGVEARVRFLGLHGPGEAGAGLGFAFGLGLSDHRRVHFGEFVDFTGAGGLEVLERGADLDVDFVFGHFAAEFGQGAHVVAGMDALGLGGGFEEFGDLRVAFLQGLAGVGGIGGAGGAFADVRK